MKKKSLNTENNNKKLDSIKEISKKFESAKSSSSEDKEEEFDAQGIKDLTESMEQEEIMIIENKKLKEDSFINKSIDVGVQVKMPERGYYSGEEDEETNHFPDTIEETEVIHSKTITVAQDFEPSTKQPKFNNDFIKKKASLK